MPGRIRLPLLYGDIMDIIPLPPAWIWEGIGSEPCTAALTMRVTLVTCGEGKKQFRPNPRYLINRQPKYPVSSGDRVIFAFLSPLKVRFETKQNKTL